MTDFVLLERRMLDIMEDLKDTLLESERAAVMEFIDHGEYGLALETLVAILLVEDKALPKGVHSKITAAAEQMGIRSDMEGNLRDLRRSGTTL